MNSSASNTTSEDDFSCYLQRVLCLQLYVPPLRVIAMCNIALNVLLSLTAVFGNALFFAAYHQKRSLRRPANTILVSLAATDFITGTVMQPLFISETIVMLGGCSDNICNLVSFSRPFMLFLIEATLLNLSLTTLDRYIAVCHSYRYVELVTNSRVRTVLAILWPGATCASLIIFLSKEVGIPLFIITMCSNIAFIGILYFKIYREISRLDGDAVVALNDPEEARKARERKRARTVAITLGVLVLCFIPLIVAGIAQVLSGGQNFVLDEALFLFSRTALFSNSSLNVLLYYWRSEEIRKVMLNVLRKVSQPATQN